MTKTIHFNTGRKYTAAGQRITATLHDDGVVTFFDHDRGIDGHFRPFPPRELSQQMVMEVYDHNRYLSGRRSWQDGMQRGACNSKYEG